MYRIQPERIPPHEALVSAAFIKAWRLLETDPILAHSPRTLLYDRLRTRSECSVETGERDVLRLANGAIRTLQLELAKCHTS
ncbi:hypothetical protein BST63_01465 [Bradyrhizobium canariense]|uniref:Uncharacterized protein n=1 Tax=Bradyrhizobium canariense TaxID=255045 RepID=A0ABX3XCA8_9BRAD|nr:hypothetical protein BSR47_01615 [Bradyrhizobium canariense]OSJ35717.1 hypothetical protein BST63_01465 [Bradyrhizobium canariense]